MVKLLLQCETINVNQRNAYGGTSLHMAICNGHVQIVPLLLGHPDVDVNETSRRYASRGRTPLHIAVEKGHTDIIKLLLNHRMTDCRCKDSGGSTPLGTAFLHFKWQAFQILAEHEGIDLQREFNFKGGDLPDVDMDHVCLMARYLLEHGELSIPSDRDRAWGQFLDEATLSGWIEVVRLLFYQPDSDVNALFLGADGIWQTAICVAARHHQHEVFGLLLNHPDINVNERRQFSYSRDTVLHCAIRYNNMTAVTLLLAREDIDLTLRTFDEQTALDLAETLERHEMVELILNHSGVNYRPEKCTAMAVMDQNMQHFPAADEEYHGQDFGIHTNVYLTENFSTGPVEDEYEEEDMEDWVGTTLV